MRRASIVVWKGAGAQPWRWHLKAANGKTIAQGEGHPTRAKAIRAAKGVILSVWASLIENPHDDPPKFDLCVSLGQTYITWA